MNEHNAPLMLGVDVGTSSTKGVVVDLSGRVLRTAVREHATSRPAPGQFEMEAGLWWSEFCSIAFELSEELEGRIEAIGVSGMGPCVVIADDDGRPLRPAILYGIDTRSETQIHRIDAEIGREAIREQCGSYLTSQSVGPKLAWIAEHEPEAALLAHYLFQPASWLAYQLTGCYGLDRHSASQCTPLFDARSLEWHEPWLGTVCPASAWPRLEFPALSWPNDVIGYTREGIPGVPVGVPVIIGTIDAWSEGISVDALRPGDLMLMYGTTMFLIATTEAEAPISSDTLWGTVGVAPGQRNLAGGMATSGAVTQWVRDLARADFNTLSDEAAASGPLARGLTLLPYFAGERTPLHDPRARGVLAGLTLDHGRGDIFRAALEGTAFGVRHILEALAEGGVGIERAVAIGGGSRNPLWAQIVSDVTGLAQVVPSITVGASYGAAFLAASVLAPVQIDEWNPSATVVRPNPRVSESYGEGYRIYRRLYEESRDVVHALARVQELHL